MKKMIIALLCCAMTLLPLAGCRSEASSKGKIVRYDIPGGITSLDPQFATDAWARMIIANTGEGLLTRGADGALEPGAAESWELSTDQKTLTFKLRDGARWEDGSPVTAHDFVFAFRRLFAAGSPSPFAEDYIAIENAAEILAGTRGAAGLGVTAKGEKTLEIRLLHPSPYFPELLAETPAIPCNEEFFNGSRGRYGFDKASVNSNGPFQLERWDNESVIQLRPNPEYGSGNPVSSAGVNLYITDEDPAARLQSGTSDAAAVSYTDAEKLNGQDFSVSYFESTVWCIVFNQSSATWGNPLLRQGLSHTIEQELLRENLPKKLTPTVLFVPPTATLAGGSYRETVTATPLEFDPEQGRRLFDMGLSALGRDKIYDDMLYVPDSADHLLAMGMVQQSWQKHLSAYITVEPASDQEIETRLATGDYGMLLLPISSATPPGNKLLSIFASDSGDNRFNYRSALYDGFLETASVAENFDDAAAACARAESLLLQDAVIIPVYVETTAFAIASDMRGLLPTAYPARLNFKYAER